MKDSVYISEECSCSVAADHFTFGGCVLVSVCAPTHTCGCAGAVNEDGALLFPRPHWPHGEAEFPADVTTERACTLSGTR